MERLSLGRGVFFCKMKGDACALSSKSLQNITFENSSTKTTLTMKKELCFLSILLALSFSPMRAQDTFSIVAVDSITGEVGSAGASCVDLFAFGLPNDDFIGVLVPNVGAINTQAYYVPANQNNATNQMNLGNSPSEIIDWLISNDVTGQAQLRQYGIAAFVNGTPATAAHTGTSTDDYKGHITGSHYSIQGNILLGQQVLDSMEARFLNEPGDLACKLMAALQGANMVGADTRCADNGTSSLFAYVKVAQPNDNLGEPSFLVSVRTAANAGIEPIDSLQTKFDAVHSCLTSQTSEVEDFDQYFSLSPNPTSETLNIHNKSNEVFNLYLIDGKGNYVYSGILQKEASLDVSMLSAGFYFVKLKNRDKDFIRKVVIE